MSFSGTYLHTIDNKNRIFVPAPFRDELGRNVKIRLSAEPIPHLHCFNEYLFDEQFKLYMEGYGAQLDRDFATMMFGSNTYNGQVDNQGRITIPAELKELAGIGENAYVLGSVDIIRIMSPECKDELFAQADEQQRRVVYAMNKARAARLMAMANGTPQV